MLKRSFMIVTLLGTMVPVAAIAGNISTRVMTAGGTATMGSGAAQTSAAGTVTKFFGTGKYYNTAGVLVPQVDAGTTVAFAPNSAAGYVVSEVKLNGVVQTVKVNGIDQPIASPVTVPAKSTGQSVTIKFARQTVAVTANAAAGGSVIPGGTKSGIVGTSLTYLFTPFAGASVQGITFAGGVAADYALTNAKTGATVTLPFAGPVAVTFTPKAGVNVTMTPSFLAITASAGSNQTVATGATVTLPGTATPAAGATFAWTQVGGPALGTPWTASIAAPTVTLAVKGSYTFQVTATSGTNTATAAVVVTAIDGYKALSVSQTARVQCENCHSAQGVGAGIFTKYSSSIHGQSAHSLCSACHNGTLTGSHPGTVNATSVNSKTMIVLQDGVVGGLNAGVGVAKGAVFCTACHTSLPHETNFNAGVTCVVCHTSSNGTGGNGDAHQIQGTSCVGCHAVAQINPFSDKSLVNESGDATHNLGVRAILGANNEFAKKSHHIFNGVGVAPTDGQCIACHLEGDISTYGGVEVNGAYHMADAKIHLRNAHDDTDLAWDPAAAASTDLTNMDNFCMSCHSATGANSAMSAKIQANLNKNPAFAGAPLATATNPFGDLVSNSYDKQSRVKVVDVDSQFNTDNYSHHAVKGKRYTTRSSATASAAWVAYSTAGGHSTDDARPAGSFNATTQKTLYDGGLMGFNGTAGTKYAPLDQAKAGTTVGDDSQLHCGDCHTVGQWKAGSSTNADGSATTAVIGAHGSVNEYMLRNTKGTDALNGLGTFICYNCHNDKAGGNTSGGYYSGAYWNNTTGKWVTAGNLHLSIHGGGSSVQYGGASGCIEVSAGLPFNDFSTAIHNNNSWRSTWATPATSVTVLLGSNGAPWDEGLGINGNQGGSIAAGTTTAPFNNPYLAIKLQSVLNGSQTVFFDASGNFTGIYSSFAAVANPTPATPSSQILAAPAINSYAAGNGNPTNQATGSGITGHNPVDLVFDADGTTIVDVAGANTGSAFYAGTGRNHFVGGNIFGNGCMNCHNVGRTGFGGIHGGKNTYTTGFSTTNHGVEGQAAPAETQSTYRFMPGLGNYGYIPAGSGKEPGKYTTDATGKATLTEEPSIAVTGKAGWEAWNGVGTSAAGGCYTNDYAKQNAGWSGCNHHGNGGVNDGGPGGTQPTGFGAGEPPTKSSAAGQVGRTLNY